MIKTWRKLDEEQIEDVHLYRNQNFARLHASANLVS